MRQLASKLGAALRLWRDQRGVAAVEFALILPVLILLYFGTIETASLFTADRRVANVAGTIGDLVSRSKKTITEAQITDYFQAASAIMQPLPTGPLRQTVSLLSVDSAGVVKVVWSRPFNGGIVRAANSIYPLPADQKINQIGRGEGLLVASEVIYSYRPLFGIVYPNALSLKHEEFFLPRFPGGIAIQ
jgi:Flp pilus assembly pilin Flp